MDFQCMLGKLIKINNQLQLPSLNVRIVRKMREDLKATFGPSDVLYMFRNTENIMKII